MDAYSNQELLDLWYKEENMTKRNDIFKILKERNLFPGNKTSTWETEAGLYPDTEDPAFIQKIMIKQEFAENLQDSLRVQQRDKKNPCNSHEEFEISPVQRFISRFLSPETPYASALLYHGVGVGKTCAAISTAEEHLRVYPKEYVYIIAPRNIQPGFRRTIFDEETLEIVKEGYNTAKGCTGNSYLMRTGMELERNRDIVIRRIKQSVNTRYKILGYTQFYNHIQGILAKSEKIPDKERRQQEQVRDLRNEFDGKMIIIDEAHNLRDSPGETEDDNLDVAGGDNEISELKAGKRLTPKLMNLLRVSQGVKIVLLTGTPMYNNYNEIIFLMNLLLMNDKRAEISEKDIFMPKIKGKKEHTVFREGGKEKLGNITSAYLSFMRGENPLSFPVRFNPEDAECPKLTQWPQISPLGEEISSTIIPGLLRLPFVPVTYEPAELRIIKAIADSVTERGGLGLRSLDEMIQSGNWLYPGTDTPETRIRDAGFDSVFQEKKEGTISRFEAREDPSWMMKTQLKKVSPKAHFILNRVQDTKGVIFIYSRFIKSGALPLALTLEANGYTPYGQDNTLFINGALDGQGRQCALCARRERGHGQEKHKFTPAKYALLTGQVNLSPNNALAIKAARSEVNVYGKDVKIVIGSQVASEGIDLRFIREIYVFDAWYHLNKMEQVLGRGVRTCSHSLLPPAERNCTIHLLVNSYDGNINETADFYMYRQGMKKAIEMGEVTRTLKEYALDCNLNFPAIYAKNMEPIERMEDSRSQIRENVSLNDTPYSSICDWMECPYACSKVVNIAEIKEQHKLDVSTYNEYAMRWRESQMKQIIRDIFEKTGQPMIQSGSLEDIFIDKDIPTMAIKTLLSDIINNKSFRIQVNSQEGYIVYRNGFYLFQPIRLADVRIPLALRVASVPVRRDVFVPAKITLTTTTLAPVVVAEDAPEGEQEVGTKGEGEVVERIPVKPIPEGSGLNYWTACIEWAKTIREETSVLDIPDVVIESIDKRYSGDKYKREYSILSMISWMYEHIKNSGLYIKDKQTLYLKVLSEVFLEIIWDESLTKEEQTSIFKTARGEFVDAVSVEQRVKKGSTEAFRFVNVDTGMIQYECNFAPCSEAVVRLFETDKTDPYNNLQVNKNTTAPIYGFIIPKLKESKFILKTSDRLVDPGQPLEKGKECENISKIADHKDQLKLIGDMIIKVGYPPFLIIDSVLNEKEDRKKERDDKKKKKKDTELTAAEREVIKMKDKLVDSFRKFQNVIKACALKNITLRMVDKLEADRGGKRYFYRPISAIKSKHKLK
jgi:hypothetical protein